MRRRLGLGAAVTGLVAGVLTTFAAPSATAADPMYQAPVVGQCFDMDVAELNQASYTEAAVDCGTEHTSQVIAVAQLPDGVAYDSAAMLRFALETCFPAQRRAVGASRLGVRLTAYDIGYFGPTAEQQAAGARWMRCDLVLTAGGRLAPLPGRLAVGKYPFSDTVSRCLSGRALAITVCAEKHAFRATAALRVDAKRFPSKSAWQRLGERRCRTAVRSSYFRFGWPSKAAWTAGDRALVCYTQTRR